MGQQALEEKINRTIICLEELEPDVLPYSWKNIVYTSAREYLDAFLNDLSEHYKKQGDFTPLTETEQISAIAVAKGFALATIFDRVLQKVEDKFLASFVPPEQVPKKEDLN